MSAKPPSNKKHVEIISDYEEPEDDDELNYNFKEEEDDVVLKLRRQS